MKIKDSLDLNGWVLSNFCIQSDSDLDTYKGKGRKLLYSGNATDEKHNREVIMGLDDKWRVAAYLDDIAAIQEQLDLLTGEVDTDSIISNMKEVSAFLSGFAEDANLMSVLNGKLNLSGGGRITVQNIGNFGIYNAKQTVSAVNFQAYVNETRKDLGYLGIENDKGPVYITSGGIAYSLLTSAGGTIKNGSKVNPFNIDTDATDTLYISLKSKGESKAYFAWNAGWGIYLQDSAANRLGLRPEGTPFYRTNDVNYSLLHSGNIGEYALKLDGSNIAPTTINANNNLNDYRYGYVTYKDAKNPTNSYGENAVVMALAGAKDDVTFQLAFDGNNDRLGYRRKSIQNTWSDWKQIAFTDSTVEAAKKIVDGNGNTKVSVLSNGYVVANGFYLTADVIERTNTTDALYLQYNAKGNTIINANGGNVLIGTTTDDNSDARLLVNGCISASATTPTERYFIAANSSRSISLRAGTASIGLYADKASKWMMYMLDNGEVRIPNPIKITGDLYVEGNIIATKEVSAGGAAEESGEGGGGTGGGVEPYVFTFTPSTTTVSVNHNISSEDVIVQVYEKDATSGKWNVILVDIEIVDSTRVDLHFGRTETTEHKVVIIG